MKLGNKVTCILTSDIANSTNIYFSLHVLKQETYLLRRFAPIVPAHAYCERNSCCNVTPSLRSKRFIGVGQQRKTRAKNRARAKKRKKKGGGRVKGRKRLPSLERIRRRIRSDEGLTTSVVNVIFTLLHALFTTILQDAKQDFSE